MSRNCSNKLFQIGFSDANRHFGKSVLHKFKSFFLFKILAASNVFWKLSFDRNVGRSGGWTPLATNHVVVGRRLDEGLAVRWNDPRGVGLRGAGIPVGPAILIGDFVDRIVRVVRRSWRVVRRRRSSEDVSGFFGLAAASRVAASGAAAAAAAVAGLASRRDDVVFVATVAAVGAQDEGTEQHDCHDARDGPERYAIRKLNLWGKSQSLGRSQLLEHYNESLNGQLKLGSDVIKLSNNKPWQSLEFRFSSHLSSISKTFKAQKEIPFILN